MLFHTFGDLIRNYIGRHIILKASRLKGSKKNKKDKRLKPRLRAQEEVYLKVALICG